MSFAKKLARKREKAGVKKIAGHVKTRHEVISDGDNQGAVEPATQGAAGKAHTEQRAAASGNDGARG